MIWLCTIYVIHEKHNMSFIYKLFLKVIIQVNLNILTTDAFGGKEY